LDIDAGHNQMIHATVSDTRRIEPIAFECECGAVLAVAMAWTSFRCFYCRAMWSFGSPENSTKNAYFSKESSGLAEVVSV
jgi:hypothetical protein